MSSTEVEMARALVDNFEKCLDNYKLFKETVRTSRKSNPKFYENFRANLEQKWEECSKSTKVDDVMSLVDEAAGCHNYLHITTEEKLFLEETKKLYKALVVANKACYELYGEKAFS